MLKYFSPLWVFIGGMFLTLGATLFFPMIFTAETPLMNDPRVVSHTYWGLSEFLTGARLFIFLLCLGCTIFATVKVWLARKNQ